MTFAAFITALAKICKERRYSSMTGGRSKPARAPSCMTPSFGISILGQEGFIRAFVGCAAYGIGLKTIFSPS